VEDGLPYMQMYIIQAILDRLFFCPVISITRRNRTTIFGRLAALKVVHQNGLLHHDVKPQNIMFQDTQVVLIGFLGITRA